LRVSSFANATAVVERRSFLVKSVSSALDHSIMIRLD
jgi:hypothetical protein